jgi:Kef-type K+ transport system membrane component KefB
VIDLPLLLLQLLVILVAARVAGWLLARVGQPQVVGEMVAGIALGPSLLGLAAPGAVEWLFPRAALAPLAALSQLGVLLFMFAVGLRLELDLLRAKARAAFVTSQASIAVPFALGAALAAWLYGRDGAGLAGAGAARLEFALFVGAAMSVTAFPVLARILSERGLVRTRLGALALACAAVDDVSAWCILAAVVAVARQHAAGVGRLAGALPPLALTCGVVAVAVLGVRPLLRRLGAGRSGATQVSVAVIAMLVLALATERAGVHALFGAFLAGVVMPRGGGLAASLADRLEAVNVTLLPVFFAFTGLRTSVGLVRGGELLAATGLILLAAVGGKLGGSAIAARLSGSEWREALGLGVLLNTRGLMELVILGVGLDIGVISPTLYTMMVLMALATTVMTTPLLALLQPHLAHAPWKAAAPSSSI